MIYLKNTPNNTGVAIYGDYMDFEALYEAMHTVVGDEDEFTAYEGARLRVLGVCYDLRHAVMGDRNIECVDNGMDTDKMKRLSTITSDKNVYLMFHVLWPELVFVTMALNDFVRLRAMKQIKSKYGFEALSNGKNIWDTSIVQVRSFQAAIAKCLKETVSETSYSRMLKLMVKDYPWFGHYSTQYIDLLNCRFLQMNPEKRLKTIPSMAKRFGEHSQEYLDIEREVKARAMELNCSELDLSLSLEYPEDIKW